MNTERASVPSALLRGRPALSSQPAARPHGRCAAPSCSRPRSPQRKAARSRIRRSLPHSNLARRLRLGSSACPCAAARGLRDPPAARPSCCSLSRGLPRCAVLPGAPAGASPRGGGTQPAHPAASTAHARARTSASPGRPGGRAPRDRPARSTEQGRVSDCNNRQGQSTPLLTLQSTM